MMDGEALQACHFQIFKVKRIVLNGHGNRWIENICWLLITKMLGLNGAWEQKIAPLLSENCTHCVTKLQYLVLLDLLKSNGGRCRIIITYSKWFEFIFWYLWLMATCFEDPAFKPSCYARNLSAAPSAWPHLNALCQSPHHFNALYLPSFQRE